MAAQAAAMLAREKKTLNIKHCIMVAMAKTVKNTNSTEGLDFGMISPP